MRLNETGNLICVFHLSVEQRKLLEADLSLRYTLFAAWTFSREVNKHMTILQRTLTTEVQALSAPWKVRRHITTAQLQNGLAAKIDYRDLTCHPMLCMHAFAHSSGCCIVLNKGICSADYCFNKFSSKCK